MPKGVYTRTDYHKKIISDTHADFNGYKSVLWKGRASKICLNCNKEFKVHFYREKTAKYCSKSCFGKHKKGNSALNWKGGNKIKTCENCGKDFEIKRWNDFKYCSIRCFNKNRTLLNHHNWRGGKSFEPYPLGWNKTFKEQIRCRDGYKCQLCGVPEIECRFRLDVHHVDYDKSNLNLYNLISLCRKCHSKTNYNRDYWRDLFYGKNISKTCK